MYYIFTLKKKKKEKKREKGTELKKAGPTQQAGLVLSRW
jgi:hypothetical protein